MEIEFWENENGMDLQFKPETIEEVAALARIAQNTKSEKPTISFYFSDKPSMSIWLKKIDKNVQINSISNDSQIKRVKK